MPTIYFDNFRGFNTTFLNLRDINFFVGENSSGKTSVLKLIGILSSSIFWQFGTFGKDETYLGSFSEIITTPSTGKEFIELGILNNESHESATPFMMRLRLIDKDNSPFIKEVCYFSQTINIQLVIEGKVIKYRFQQENKDECYSIESFGTWLADNGLNDQSFTRLEANYSGVIPALIQVSRSILTNIGTDIPKVSEIQTYRIFDPSLLTEFAWFSPIRAKPLPVYKFEGLRYDAEGRHSPSVLREILPGEEVKRILNQFGTDSGLYDDISITHLNDSPTEADLFSVNISIKGTHRNITNVGYGVSQILPVVIEAIARMDNTWFLIQQPETHLHPRAQAAFGEFIFKAFLIDRQKFIIETHSDYVLDRYRLRLNRSMHEETEIQPGQVVFFRNQEGQNILEIIELLHDGSYSEKQPKEFREFFIKEQLNLITI